MTDKEVDKFLSKLNKKIKKSIKAGCLPTINISNETRNVRNSNFLVETELTGMMTVSFTFYVKPSNK